ncbi:HTH-type transcriptional activator IlvY [Glaciecola sp. HTCC2999]|jgi:LysR family transcriptional regulator, positive regulator for ilvC|uniref:HTH-type transcriptional activator IlvY n=1 Tax=Glaciecola sp. HTCC2999 TaxID=455436 RepID=UPI0000E10E04|nr:HTH-type transcriptional activator IlvY [Glaciecola sp. HTCC2999]
MDIKSLAMFNHLAQSLHFGQTAKAMFVTPSTLSRAIQRLEQDAGATLFQRNNRKVSLTPEGRLFLSFSIETVQQWQSLQSQLAQQTQYLTGEMSVYCSVTAAHSHLPGMLNQFRAQHPQVDIKLVTGDPALSIQKVLDGQADVAISIKTPQMHPDIRFKAIDDVPLVLVVPKSLGIRHLRQIKWDQHQIIMPESGPSKRIVHHWFAEHNIRPKVYASVGGNEAIVSMVALGFGIGIVPSIVLDNSAQSNQVIAINIDDIESYQIGLCCHTRKQDEPMIKAMFEL